MPTDYRKVWLEAHPSRTAEWLNEMAAEGFEVQHLDDNRQNNIPSNLVLIEGEDHAQLHRRKIAAEIWWRAKAAQKRAAAGKARLFEG